MHLKNALICPGSFLFLKRIHNYIKGKKLSQYNSCDCCWLGFASIQGHEFCLKFNLLPLQVWCYTIIYDSWGLLQITTIWQNLLQLTKCIRRIWNSLFKSKDRWIRNFICHEFFHISSVTTYALAHHYLQMLLTEYLVSTTEIYTISFIFTCVSLPLPSLIFL